MYIYCCMNMTWTITCITNIQPLEGYSTITLSHCFHIQIVWFCPLSLFTSQFSFEILSFLGWETLPGWEYFEIQFWNIWNIARLGIFWNTMLKFFSKYCQVGNSVAGRISEKLPLQRCLHRQGQQDFTV